MWHLLWDMHQAGSMPRALWSHLLHEVCLRYSASLRSLSQSMQPAILSRPTSRSRLRLLLSLQPFALPSWTALPARLRWTLPNLFLRGALRSGKEAIGAGIPVLKGSSVVIFYWVLWGDDRFPMRTMPGTKAMSILLSAMLTILLCELSRAAMCQGRVSDWSLLQFPTNRQSELYMRPVRNQHCGLQRWSIRWQLLQFRYLLGMLRRIARSLRPVQTEVNHS